MNDILSVERERNLRRRQAYDLRVAAHGIDSDDRDARARRGREFIASMALRTSRHCSLVPITGADGLRSASHAR